MIGLKKSKIFGVKLEDCFMELTQCINYLLTTAQHAVFQEMSARLASYDLTPVQYGVLYCLWCKNKTKPKEIAEELKLENSTISGVLERMEKKELIERQISKEDRRFVEICLTIKGEALQKPVLQTVEEVNNDVMKVIPVEKQEELKQLLRALAGIEQEEEA